MRYPIRASELVHRRLWVPPSPLHDPSAQELHDESSWGWETVRCVLDWGHQSGMVRPCSCPAGVEAGQGPKDAEHAMPLQTRVAVVSIDDGKSSFQIVGQDHRAQIVQWQKWSG